MQHAGTTSELKVVSSAVLVYICEPGKIYSQEKPVRIYHVAQWEAPRLCK